MVLQALVVGIVIMGAYISLNNAVHFVNDMSYSINSLEDLWKFRLEYQGLKGVQILDIYDVKCNAEDLKNTNKYLLKARQNYLYFLNKYNDMLSDDFVSNFYNDTKNFFILNKLKLYAKNTISNYKKFVYYLAVSFQHYGSLLDQDYKKLCWIGADLRDFPGNLRKKYVEYKNLNDYLNNRSVLKGISSVDQLKPYQREFLVGLSYLEESKKAFDNILAYEYFFKSVREICKNHQEINMVIRNYEKEIDQKKVILQKRYIKYLKQYKTLSKYCYNYDTSIFNNVSVIKSGDINTPKEMCKNVEKMLNEINFNLYSNNQEDYIYLNYLKLSKIERNLDKIEIILDQIKDDINNINKTCFFILKEYINNEKDEIIRKFLLEKYKIGTFSSCADGIKLYNSLNNVKCNIYDLEKKLVGLDSVGYDVSYEIKLLNECKENIVAYDVCCNSLLENVYSKYNKFKKDLINLEKKFNTLNNLYFKVFGSKQEITYKDEFEEYEILKQKTKEIERVLKKYIVDHLKNNTFIVYLFENLPLCNDFSNFKVIVKVNNDLGFDIENITYFIEDAFGKYVIKGKIKKGLNEFVFEKYDKTSFCIPKVLFVKGNNWITYKTYLINVSSLSKKVKFCFKNEIVINTNSTCIDLFNGKNLVYTISKTKVNYHLFNNYGYLNVPIYYNIFCLYTNITNLVNTTIKHFYKNGKVVFVFYNVSSSSTFYWKNIKKTKNTTYKNDLLNNKNDSLLNDEDISNQTFKQILESYRNKILEEIENKTNKYKYYPSILKKLFEIKNEIKNKKNLSIEELYNYQKRVDEIKYNPKNFDDLVNFACYIGDCNIIEEQYEKYKKGGISEDLFKAFLEQEITKDKREIKESFENLHISYNLRRLMLCFGENSSVYSQYLEKYNKLKQSFFEHLNKNSTKVLNYLNRLKNLNARIETLIEIEKYKAKYMIDRLKLLLKNVDNVDTYKDQINTIVDLYKNGKYTEVILKIKKLIKELNLKPKQQDSIDINSIFVIFIFIGLVIGLIFVFNGKDEKKKIIIKRTED